MTAFKTASVLALMAATFALPAAAQSWNSSGWAYADQARSYSSHGRHGHDYNGQQDRPGDFGCDAYWDRGRDDCDARWRDQRPFRTYSSYPRYSRYREHDGGGYVYQPYNQGRQYYGAYGRPDQVYPGSGYGGQVGGAYRGAGQRDVNRTAWCASRYRSYDPASGYYRAYSGRLVFCG